jgi:hypothetical protein
MSNISDLYIKAIATDDAFSAELTRVFGVQACNARYDKRGQSTPELKDLSSAKRAADQELHNAFMASR